MKHSPIIISWFGFVGSSFLRNRSLLLASSLSYTTVLSLVPFLAVAFSVAKGFGIYETSFLRDVLLRLFAEKAEVVDAVLGYIQNTNVKALGFIGVATLFITSFGLLSTMEEAFNIIWHAKSSRGMWSRFSNYITVILVCPLFILAAFSWTATLQNASVVQWLREIALVNWAFTMLLKLVPTVMVTISLFIVYKFLPNVRVNAAPAGIGALVSGLAWQSTQALYIKYQVGVTGYNAIYGSFAQIPLLLVWLYISWLIVLAGAEIANASQNYVRIRDEDAVRSYSYAERRDAALVIALLLTERSEGKLGALSDLEAGAALDLPVKLVAEELARLTRIGIAARVADEGEGERYMLAAAPDRITVGELVAGWDALRAKGGGEDLAGRFPVLADIRAKLNETCRAGSRETLRDVWAAMGGEEAPGSK